MASDLRELVENVRIAKQAVEAELEKRWPEDSIVYVHLSKKQRHVTEATVLGYEGEYGQVRVRCHTEKGLVRSVPWHEVYGEEDLF